MRTFPHGRGSGLTGGRRKTLGLCPKPCLGDFLRRSPLRTFKTFNSIGFLLHGANFWCSHIPCYEFRLLRAKSRPAGFCRLTPRSRYRIEMVGELHLNGTERHMGRSLQTSSLREFYPFKVVPPPLIFQKIPFSKRFYLFRVVIRWE